MAEARDRRVISPCTTDVGNDTAREASGDSSLSTLDATVNDNGLRKRATASLTDKRNTYFL